MNTLAKTKTFLQDHHYVVVESSNYDTRNNTDADITLADGRSIQIGRTYFMVLKGYEFIGELNTTNLDALLNFLRTNN